jgi:hypothetical protein
MHGMDDVGPAVIDESELKRPCKRHTYPIFDQRLEARNTMLP